MATDVLVSRELKSLQDELSAAKTQRSRNWAESMAGKCSDRKSVV